MSDLDTVYKIVTDLSAPTRYTFQTAAVWSKLNKPELSMKEVSALLDGLVELGHIRKLQPQVYRVIMTEKEVDQLAYDFFAYRVSLS